MVATDEGVRGGRRGASSHGFELLALTPRMGVRRCEKEASKEAALDLTPRGPLVLSDSKGGGNDSRREAERRAKALLHAHRVIGSWRRAWGQVEQWSADYLQWR